MKFKIIIPFLAGALVMWIFWMIVATDTRATNVPKAQPEWKFTLPEGNSQAGKEKFIELQCYTCHNIDIPGFDAPETYGEIGPDLTLDYTKLSLEYLAESIIKGHEQVANRDYEKKKDVAGMGNYNDFLTVTELTNLAAFLKERK